jgi:hypothetical protein
VADRYCRNCGQELPEDSRFCPNCGTPIQEAAHVPTPEADVQVPPPQQQAWETATPLPQQGGVQAPRRSTANKRLVGWVAYGSVALFVVFLIVLASGNQAFGVVVMLLILPALAFLFRRGGMGGPATSPAVSSEPLSEDERLRILEVQIGHYTRRGFFVRERTASTAQLIKPKNFSFLWALLWFLLFGIGLVVYLIYYAAKKDEGRYVSVNEYGAVTTTRQIHWAL